MPKTMFPELIQNKEQALIGLRVEKVISTLSGTLKRLECVDDAGELHVIEFHNDLLIVDGSILLTTKEKEGND